jgi:hypothetical protein
MLTTENFKCLNKWGDLQWFFGIWEKNENLIVMQSE